MYKPLLLLAATGLIAAAPAADLDGNGEVTRAEFMAAGDARFAAADADFDGQLTREEMRTLRDNERNDNARRHFAKIDANDDGVVTEEEMLAAANARTERREDRREEMKARIDTDGDGEISKAERDAARDAMKERRKEMKEHRKELQAQHKQRRKGLFGKKRPRLDANRDGVISKAEYDAMGEALFDRMDANGDGVLTQGEGRRRGLRGPQGAPPPGL